MQKKLIMAVLCFVFLVLAAIFLMQFQENKAMIPILESQLDQAKADLSQSERWAKELQAANEDLARQLWETELSYRNVRQFVWNAREELDRGNEEYALTCFEDLWKYQATEEEIDKLVKDQTLFSSSVPEDYSEDPQLKKAFRAYLLKDAFGLAYQLGYQCKNWEPLHRILDWILTEAPEVFDLGYYYEPFPAGTMVLNHGVHHAMFVLANSDRSEDLELISRIIRDIPLHQKLFVSLVYNMEVYLDCTGLEGIPNLPKNLQAMARQRALQEWELVKGQVHPDELDLILASPVEFEGTKTNRELLAEVLKINV